MYHHLKSSLEILHQKDERNRKNEKKKRKAMCCNRLADRVVLQMISAKQPEGCQIGRRVRLPLQLAIKKRLGAIHKPLPSRYVRLTWSNVFSDFEREQVCTNTAFHVCHQFHKMIQHMSRQLVWLGGKSQFLWKRRLAVDIEAKITCAAI